MPRGRFSYLLLATYLVVPLSGHAQPQQSDVFNTSGEYDQFAVGGAHRWYDNHTTEAKEKSSHCLSILADAKVFQDQGLALDEAARQLGIDSRQATALRKQANEQFGLRDKTIRAFIECFNLTNRRPVLEGRAEQNEGLPSQPPQDNQNKSRQKKTSSPTPKKMSPQPERVPDLYPAPVPPASSNEKPASPNNPNQTSGRYTLGQPDPPFIFADGISKGMADCFQENLPADLATAPLVILKRLERLKKAVETIGKAGSIYAVYEDIKAYDLTADPYEVGKWLGKLICDGKDLKQLIKQKTKPHPGQQPASRPGPTQPSPEESPTASSKNGQPAEAPPGSGSCSPKRKDCFWRTLHNATGDPSYLFQQEQPTWEEVYAKLKQHFGGPKTKDPLTGRPDDFQKMAEGQPIPVSVEDFGKIINRMPNNSEGMVFITREDGSAHVFNLAKFAGTYMFWDGQVRSSNMDILFAGTKTIKWFRYK